MRNHLQLSLKILAIIFWLYIPIFILSILPLLGVSVSNFFFTEFRGENYIWDFELMFIAIFSVWGYYLWKISKNPLGSLTFIDFTIWATIFHLFAMLLIGVIRSSDLSHMLKDVLGMGLPLLFVIYNRINIK